MRLCIPFIVLLLLASSPVTPQNAAPKAAKAIDTIEDVEIGMSADTANYRITLYRSADGKSSSFVTKLAPFVKTK